MRLKRGSGILLHPTSLPGDYGIGSLGRVAFEFIDHLANAGQSYWQVLPLGPPGYGNSPYQSFSAFAGYPDLIDLDLLIESGLLLAEDLKKAPPLKQASIDFDAVRSFKSQALRMAFDRFEKSSPEKKETWAAFCLQNHYWLDDYCMFCALKNSFGGSAWSEWPAPIRKRDPEELKKAEIQLRSEIEFHRFQQYLFFVQMQAVHRYAKSRSIQIIGDMPIFVAADSADAWAHPEYFRMDSEGRLEVVAGVPPDYFSSSGQRWGNPVYCWDVLKRTGFLWWIKRFMTIGSMVDCVRIDHFRGFEKYWEIPADRPDAIEGRWADGPGADFFTSLNASGVPVTIIAEDLGFITPEVIELRDNLGLPGMKILQFAFGDDARNPYLPHNYSTPNCIVYTGTHDNDTTIGWFRNPSTDAASATRIRAAVNQYLENPKVSMHWPLIRLAQSSIADVAIIPAQDLLGLGPESRMNIPGKADGNWTWRLDSFSQLKKSLEILSGISKIYSR